MYKNYFFIGLGGSGGKTLRFLKRDLRKWMDENGAEGDAMPDAWQFLHIDTPTAIDGSGLDTSVVPMLEPDEYLGLVNAGVSYPQVQAMLDGDQAMHDEIQTWRVEPAAIGVPIGQGAGQFRAIGKTIATAYMPIIKGRLDTSIARMKNAQNVSELRQLYQKITNDTPKQDSNIVYVIISSLAGGTGAGLLFPVTDLVRGIDSVAGGDSIGLLYTPEVFSSLGAAMTGGVQANSLAAISELLNGYWWGGSPTKGGNSKSIVDPKSSAALKKAGLPFALERSGPAFPFVIGRTGSSGVTFGAPEELFEMVGRSLVSWLVDPVVEENLISYVIGNWEAQSSSHKQNDVLVASSSNVNQQLAHETGYPNLSGLGFARVGIGSDWFEKYSTRKLALDAARVMAQAHVESPEAIYYAGILNTKDPDVVALEWAKNLLPEFMRTCGLSELGPNENQIQESLCPHDMAALKQDAAINARTQSVLHQQVPLKGNEWVSQIEGGIDLALTEFQNKFEEGLKLRITEWVSNEIPIRVIRAVERQISICGLKTSAAIVRMAAQLLVDEVATELAEHDYPKFEKWHRNWRDEVRAQLNSLGRNKLDPSDPVVQRALDDGLLFGLHYGEAQIAQRASQLLPDFARNFLLPLSEALENAQSEVSQTYEDMRGWPSWEGANPPPSVCPPPSEFTLIKSDDFSELFSDLLSDSVGATVKNAAREVVRADIISSEFVRDQVKSNPKSERDFEHLYTVKVQKDWWPASNVIGSGIKPMTRAQIELRVSLSDIEGRAKAWLLQPNSPFEQLVKCSLSDYLGDTSGFGGGAISTQEYTRRGQVFMSQFRAAYNAASPLVNINRGLLAAVHPDTDGKEKVKKIVSQIPLSNHPLEDQMRTELIAMGESDASASKALTVNPRVKFVDICSVLWPPHSVLPIESLVRPIAADWNSSVQGGAVPSFWLRRRATRLQEFIPAPQAIIVSMIRGWYIATFMGLLDRTKFKDHEISIALGKEGTQNFPSPFLSVSGDRDDAVALVLESLSIAYMECSVDGNLEPLRPYIRLRDLGRNTAGSFYDYPSLGTEFEEFLSSGNSQFKIVDPLIVGSTLQERAESAERLLRDHQSKLSDKLAKITEERRLSPAKLSNPPLFTGLMVPISKALDDLVKAVVDFSAQSDNGPGL